MPDYVPSTSNAAFTPGEDVVTPEVIAEWDPYPQYLTPADLADLNVTTGPPLGSAENPMTTNGTRPNLPVVWWRTATNPSNSTATDIWIQT